MHVFIMLGTYLEVCVFAGSVARQRVYYILLFISSTTYLELLRQFCSDSFFYATSLLLGSIA